MLLLIIPSIVFMVVALTIFLTDGELGFGIAFGLIAALLAMMLTFCVGLGFQNEPTEVMYSETCEIHALVDNARFNGKISGNIYLIQSRADTALKYSYMYMVEGKGYAFAEVPAASCYLNYTDGEPYMVRNTLGFQNKALEWLIGYCGGYEYIFYLPHDAEVIDDFIIDFE